MLAQQVMQNSPMKFHIWCPAAFAGLLTAMKLFLPDGAGGPAYYCFLPMCFVFAASAQMMLLKRLEALEVATGHKPQRDGDAAGS